MNNIKYKIISYVLVLFCVMQMITVLFNILSLNTEIKIELYTPFFSLPGFIIISSLVIIFYKIIRFNISFKDNQIINYLSVAVIVISSLVFIICQTPFFWKIFTDSDNIIYIYTLWCVFYLLASCVIAILWIYTVKNMLNNSNCLYFAVASQIIFLATYRICIELGGDWNSYKASVFRYIKPIIIVVIICAISLLLIRIKSIMHNKITGNVWKLFAEQQKNYIDKMYKQDEQIRKFKHDITNHLIVLKDHIEKNEYVSLMEYVDTLLDELGEMSNVKYDVGNNLLNILINYYLSEADDSISVSVGGKLGDLPNIKEKDLCIVFSNLIKNSIEAIDNIDTDQDKFIKIEIKRGRNFASFEIENTAHLSKTQVKKINGGSYISTKDDNLNIHGFGLNNVKDVVDKMDGQLNVWSTENIFKATVYLPVGE